MGSWDWLSFLEINESISGFAMNKKSHVLSCRTRKLFLVFEWAASPQSSHLVPPLWAVCASPTIYSDQRAENILQRDSPVLPLICSDAHRWNATRKACKQKKKIPSPLPPFSLEVKQRPAELYIRFTSKFLIFSLMAVSEFLVPLLRRASFKKSKRCNN